MKMNRALTLAIPISISKRGRDDGGAGFKRNCCADCHRAATMRQKWMSRHRRACNSSGSLAIFAAIRRAASPINIVGPALATFFDVPPVTDLNCEYDLFIWARIDGRIMGSECRGQ